MIAIDSIGILNIIDEVFDRAYYGVWTPYELEHSASVIAFFRKLYPIIKDKSIFEDEKLLNTYKEAVYKVIKKIEQIENRKVYKFTSPNSIGEREFITNVFKKIWSYVEREIPKNLTINEQKSGYYEEKDGKKFFNGYKEDIILGQELIPSYIGDEVQYTREKNPVAIRFFGSNEGKPVAEICHPRYSSLYSYSLYKDRGDPGIIELFLGIANEKIRQEFYIKSEGRRTYETYFAFSSGFIVNNMNEYENPNGKMYELFKSIYAALLNPERNYFNEFLKKYFYDGIVSRYREKRIEDRETNIRSHDNNFGRDTNVIPGVYETLSGKGGNIGGVTTVDFDRRIVIGLVEYNRMLFEKSYYDLNTGDIELYIPKENLSGLLKVLKRTNSIEGYIDKYINKYKKLKYYENYSPLEKKKFLEENKERVKFWLLRSVLFAVEPFFMPTNTDENWNKEFFVNNINNFQKVYFYNDNLYFDEDQILTELTLLENKAKDKQRTVQLKERNIDVSFNEDYLIIKLKPGVEIVNPYEKRFTMEDYKKSLGGKKVALGDGYINLRKVPQHFKDNKVSKLQDCPWTNKNAYMESEEFSSILDDREISVVHQSIAQLANTSDNGYTNSYYDEELDMRFEEKGFPNFKRTKLYKKDYYYELEVTDFSKKNSLDTISQVRIVDATSNKRRFLFNVRGVRKERKENIYAYFDIDLEDLSSYNITYVKNGKIYFPKESVNGTKYIKSSDYEDFSIVYGSEGYRTVKDEYKVTSLEDKNYVSNYDLVLNNENTMYVYRYSEEQPENQYTLVIDETEKKEKLFSENYYLILEKNDATNIEIDKDVMDVEILDFVQMEGVPVRRELKQLVYNEDGSYDDYKYKIEPDYLIFNNYSKKFKILFSKEYFGMEYKRILHFFERKLKKFGIKLKLEERFRLNPNIIWNKIIKISNKFIKGKFILNLTKWLKMQKKIFELELDENFDDYNVSLKNSIHYHFDSEETYQILPMSFDWDSKDIRIEYLEKKIESETSAKRKKKYQKQIDELKNGGTSNDKIIFYNLNLIKFYPKDRIFINDRDTGGVSAELRFLDGNANLHKDNSYLIKIYEGFEDETEEKKRKNKPVKYDKKEKKILGKEEIEFKKEEDNFFFDKDGKPSKF